MRKLLLSFFLLLTFCTYAQSDLQKGYFITNADAKVECLIKNKSWRNNPDQIEYKINETGELKTVSVDDIKYFEILDQSKYISATVKIDMSTDNISSLSKFKDPDFVEKKVFLKQIISGKANLYEYTNQGVSRFFMQIGSGDIEPLVYKRYEIEENKIAYNYRYINQLKGSLLCEGFNMEQAHFEYSEKSLIKLFNQFNACSNPDYKPLVKVNQGVFNLNIRPRVNLSTMNVLKYFQNNEVTFSNKVNFSVGLEAEYILGYDRKRWAIIVEPVYQYFKSSITKEASYLVGGKETTSVDYKAIELPLGLRYYINLKNNSKIFINAQYVLDFPINSMVRFTRADGSEYNSFKIKNTPNYALGVGYKFANKYGLELKYFTERQLTIEQIYAFTSFNSISVILSYKLF